MAKAEFSVPAGQTSAVFLVGLGERVTTTGTGAIQYTLSGIVDINNSLATWISWPNGTTSGFDDALTAIYCRAVATTAMTVAVTGSDTALDGTVTKTGLYWAGSNLSSAAVAALADAPTSINGNVTPRNSTFAALMQLSGNDGEISYPTDYAGIRILHNGVANGARAIYDCMGVAIESDDARFDPSILNDTTQLSPDLAGSGILPWVSSLFVRSDWAGTEITFGSFAPASDRDYVGKTTAITVDASYVADTYVTVSGDGYSGTITPG